MLLNIFKNKKKNDFRKYLIDAGCKEKENGTFEYIYDVSGEVFCFVVEVNSSEYKIKECGFLKKAISNVGIEFFGEKFYEKKVQNIIGESYEKFLSGVKSLILYKGLEKEGSGLSVSIGFSTEKQILHNLSTFCYVFERAYRTAKDEISRNYEIEKLNKKYEIISNDTLEIASSLGKKERFREIVEVMTSELRIIDNYFSGKKGNKRQKSAVKKISDGLAEILET